MKQIIKGSEVIEDESHCLQKGTTDTKTPIFFNDLFAPEFMRLYTQYNSIEEFLSSGGFDVSSDEDYESIPDEAIDAYVLKTTNFNSWKEMLTEAIESYTSNQFIQ